MVKGSTRISVASVLVLALGTGIAHADDKKKMVAAADTKTGDASATTTPVIKTVPDVPSPAWPVEIINRPTVLPKGAWSAGVGISANNDFSALGVDATGLWGLSYGFTERLTVGVGYGVSIEPSSDGRGPVGVNAGYTYYAKGPLTLSATASASYDFAGETMGPLSFGTYVWYNITPKITLITPGGQVSFGMESPNEISISLPVSIGYQFSKHVFGTFDTNLLPNIGVKNSDNMLIGADTLPVGVTGYYSPGNYLDIGLSVSTDAKNSPGDSLSFGLVLLYYGGV